VRASFLVLTSAAVLGGCAIASKVATQEDVEKITKCFADLRAQPEGQIV
jgi:hypothetical protein